MTYFEQIRENFKDTSTTLGNTTILGLSEGIGAVSVWMAHNSLRDSASIEDYLEVMNPLSPTGFIHHAALMQFVFWLMNQEVPEFDEEKGAWCDMPLVIDKYNEYVEQKNEEAK